MTVKVERAKEPQIAHGVRTPVPGTGVTLRYEDDSELSPDDVRQLISLFERAFNGGPSWFRLGVTPEAHLRWKAGPDRGAPTRIELTEDESGIVGFRMTMWRRFLVRGTVTSVTEGVDATLDPRLQGRRITSQRADFSTGRGMRGQACFAMGYAMHPTSRVRRGVPGKALISAERVDSVVKPLSARRLLERRRSQRTAKPEAPTTSRTRSAMEARERRWTSMLSGERVGFAMRLAWAFRPRRTPRCSWRIETTERFDDRATAFFEEASAPFDLIQVRDAAYLNWRFCDRRGGAFLVRVVQDGDAVLGYSALRADASGAVLADLLALPQHDDVAKALIDDAMEQARRQGAPSISARLPRSHPYRRLLARAGFARNPLPLTLSYAAVDCSEDSLHWLTEPGVRLHIMTADTDHV